MIDCHEFHHVDGCVMSSEAGFMEGLIFGSIGLAALMYGKSIGSGKKMVLGGMLMGCSYFITPAWLMWTVGGLLTAALMMWKD